MSWFDVYGDPLAERLANQAADRDREIRYLREVWQAMGCAGNPDDFKASVRDRMWATVIDSIRNQERDHRRAYEAGRADTTAPENPAHRPTSTEEK